MDDLDPELKDDELEAEEDLEEDEEGKKIKKPKEVEEDSLDALAEEEETVLPEDGFDDVEPEDLW
jgi:hypothetical protein